MEGLDDGRAAAILKVHHALTDGIGGMQLATEVFDAERDAPNPDAGPVPPADEVPGLVRLSVEALGYRAAELIDRGRHLVGAAPRVGVDAIRRPIATVIDVLRLGQSIARTVQPMRETYSPVMNDRRLGWHYTALDLRVDDLKRAAKAAEGTLNDAFLAGIAGGLDRYHDQHGHPVPELRLTMPISIRRESDPAGGNRVTLMRFSVPIDASDPITRVRVLHERAGGESR